MPGTFCGMASLTLDLVQVAAIIGALQGLLLAGVLMAQRSNVTANRLLAALMATFSVYFAWGPYYTAGLYRVYPHFILVSYLTPWVFGPLVYLYTRAASDRSWRFGRRELLHFALVTLVFFLALPFFIKSGAEKVALWDAWGATGGPDDRRVGPPLRYIDPLKYVSGIAYSAATVLYLLRHRHDVEHSYSNLARVNLRWLVWLSSATGGIWLLAAGLVYLQVRVSLRDADITLAMALLVYAIGYMGLRQPEIFRLPAVEAPAVNTVESGEAAAPDATAQPSAERSGLGEDEARKLEASLLAAMEREQPWKNCELTLPELAACLDTTTHKLSEVLNARMGQTFYDFVNGYRVREVQRRIKAGDARALKMLALAMDAGFASKSTFNDVFKKQTNQTPSSYRQAVGG
jgi:AraC-like DNA-binding protein